MSNKPTSLLQGDSKNVINTSSIDAQDDTSNSKKTAIAYISDKTILAFVLGTIGYFYGWRFLYAYYGNFGLDPSVFKFSPIDIIAAGWRMYGFVAAAILLGVFVRHGSAFLTEKNIIKSGLKTVLRYFSLFTIVGLLFGIYVVYLFIFVRGGHTTSIFYICAYAAIAFLWLAYSVGEKIYTILETEKKPQNFQHYGFRIIYPNSYIWLVGLVLLFVGTTALFSSWNGYIYAERDQGPGCRLQIVDLLVQDEISLPNPQIVSSGIELNEDFRFLFSTDDILFVFKLEEVKDGIPLIYGIPKQYVVEYRLKQWYDKVVHP